MERAVEAKGGGWRRGQMSEPSRWLGFERAQKRDCSQGSPATVRGNSEGGKRQDVVEDDKDWQATVGDRSTVHRTGKEVEIAGQGRL